MKIFVKVVPNSKKASIEKLDDGNFRVRVDRPPSEGKANDRLRQILAEYFDVPPSRVSIIKGHRGRNKIIEIS
ncbi:MAG: DUF167 domain-containing protein [Fidelibacterota bacterium]